MEIIYNSVENEFSQKVENQMRKNFDKIIKKSVKAIKKEHKKDTPKITDSFYYGLYSSDFCLLYIVYAFKTDFDLQYAKDSGLTEKIETETVKELIKNDYPEFTLNARNDLDISGDAVFVGIEKLEQQFINKKQDMRVTIFFESREEEKSI